MAKKKKATKKAKTKKRARKKAAPKERTLRDEFAMYALDGLVGRVGPRSEFFESMARSAYLMADEMLKARR